MPWSPPPHLARRYPRLSRWARLAVDGGRSIERAVRPGRRAWRGAARGLLVGTILVLVVLIYYWGLRPTATYAKLWGVGERIGEVLLATAGILLGLWVVRRIPRPYVIALAFAAMAVGPTVGGLADSPAGPVLYIVAWSLVGAGLAVLGSGRWPQLTRIQRGVTAIGTVAGLALIAIAALWLVDPGMPPVEVRNAAAEGTAPAPLDLPDPAAEGPHEVLALTYGSGEDFRHEFGRDADLVTATVDGSAMVDWDDDWERRRFWGFDADEMPLQGRVWYPDGPGPFPLVLIVHGNHAMEEFSDPGYEYLGRLLASRGYILVSVDENFINGSIRNENDARGWLLLEHLRQWSEWNDAADGPFAGRVDMSRIGLIGHSRGGEAVAVAAAFNELPYYPDDATVAFEYGFEIGAVIAIAPIYGQYRPAGILTPLEDVNYLVIHGANDADVSSFAGAAQFENVHFSGNEPRFKAAIYVYGANHGQFNSVWGATDFGPPYSAVLNTAALIPEEDQRRIGSVFMSAFLEATLGGESGYLPLFSDPRRGAPWLPDTVYLADFRDSAFRTVADFDEDIDVTTLTLPGGSVETAGLTRWREDRVATKWGDKGTNAVHVGWQRPAGDDASDDHGSESDPEAGADDDQAAAEPARYTLRLGDGFDASGATALVMSIADTGESPAPRERNGNDGGDHQSEEAQADATEANEPDDDEDGERDSDDDDAPPAPIDFTVRLTDLDGNIAELPLSRFAPVQPELEVELRKAAFGEPSRSSEPVYQSFVLELDWFVAAAPGLDLARLASIELRFDRSEEGVVAVDDIGFAYPLFASAGPV